MLSVVATRYAHALAEVALAPGSGLEPAAALEQIRRVEDLMRESAELRHVMLSPAVSSAKKRAVMAQFGASLGLDRKIRNFLFVIIDHRRMHQLTGIREAFETALDERLGFVRADVSSVSELTEAQRGALQAELEKITGRRVRARYAVDRSLIGGVVDADRIDGVRRFGPRAAGRSRTAPGRQKHKSNGTA